MATVRSNGSSCSNFRFLAVLLRSGGLCVSVQFNREGLFRFRFLKSSSSGSSSALGSWKNGFRRFRFGCWATLLQRKPDSLYSKRGQNLILTLAPPNMPTLATCSLGSLQTSNSLHAWIPIWGPRTLEHWKSLSSKRTEARWLSIRMWLTLGRSTKIIFFQVPVCAHACVCIYTGGTKIITYIKNSSGN